MKVKRQKKVNRYLMFFKNNFKFREPYQILVDGTFCQAALEYKLNIKDQIPKYLDGQVKFLTTSCVVTETEKLGPKLFGATLIVKQFGVHKCGHKNPIPASDCLLTMIGESNTQHYMIATQDKLMRQKARTVPGTPVLYLNYNAPLLEKPSYMNESSVAEMSKQKFGLSSFEEETLKTLKRKEFGDPTEEEPEVVKKRRRIKGPNPLSCKKKKKKKPTTDNPPPPPTKNKTRSRKKRNRGKVT